jgi:hypothetical protein
MKPTNPVITISWSVSTTVFDSEKNPRSNKRRVFLWRFGAPWPEVSRETSSPARARYKFLIMNDFSKIFLT